MSDAKHVRLSRELEKLDVPESVKAIRPWGRRRRVRELSGDFPEMPKFPGCAVMSGWCFYAVRGKVPESAEELRMWCAGVFVYGSGGWPGWEGELQKVDALDEDALDKWKRRH